MEGNVAQNKTNACRSPTPCIDQYIDRGKRLGRVNSGKTAIIVKNSVLPRWRSAAIMNINLCWDYGHV